MFKQILIIQARPDASRSHLCPSRAAGYRGYFRAHSVKSLERNVLGFIGIAPLHETLIGLTGDVKPDAAAKWVGKLERSGEGAK